MVDLTPPWHRDIGLWVHVVLTGIILGLSATLALPGDTMGNPNWTAFRAIASEGAWSYAFLLVAWIGAMGIGRTRPRWMMLGSTMTLSTVHTTVAWLFFKSAWAIQVANTGVLTYACIAVLGFVLCMVRFSE